MDNGKIFREIGKGLTSIANSGQIPKTNICPKTDKAANVFIVIGFGIGLVGTIVKSLITAAGNFNTKPVPFGAERFVKNFRR